MHTKQAAGFGPPLFCTLRFVHTKQEKTAA